MKKKKRKIKIPKGFYKKLDFALTFDWNAFYKLCRDNTIKNYIKFNKDFKKQNKKIK